MRRAGPRGTKEPADSKSFTGGLACLCKGSCIEVVWPEGDSPGGAAARTGADL